VGVAQRLVQIKSRQDGSLRVVCLGQCRAKHGHETSTGYVQEGAPMAVHLRVNVLTHDVHHVREGRKPCVCAQRHGIGQRTA
jgi:hypothetical protein